MSKCAKVSGLSLNRGKVHAAIEHHTKILLIAAVAVEDDILVDGKNYFHGSILQWQFMVLRLGSTGRDVSAHSVRLILFLSLPILFELKEI